MSKNVQLLFLLRLYGSNTVAYGHAMPCDSEWKHRDSGLRLLAPVTFEAQGITMPISRGGPPVLTE